MLVRQLRCGHNSSCSKSLLTNEPLVKPRVFIDKINGDMTMEPLQITLILPNSKKSLDSEKMTIGTTNELLKYIYKYNCLNK